MYSSIKRKKCNCSDDCKLWPTIGFEGRNYLHATEEVKERQGLKAKRKYQNKLAKARKSTLSRKLHNVQDKSNQLSELSLQVWFDNRMNTCEAKCENCGKEAHWLKQSQYRKLWKSCQAHLLPKRHFKSIATHPLNGMVLFSGFSQGGCQCHDDWDSSWSKASSMYIWDEVCIRFLILYSFIKPEEHQYIPKQLLEMLNTL